MDKRVRFDFEIDFLNGGGLQGQDFRLDVHGEEISDQELADAIVRDLRLLMVGPVRILKKEIIEEAHKRSAGSTGERSQPVGARLVDLSHTAGDLGRGDSRARHALGTTLDAPSHPSHGGDDLSVLPLGSVAELPGLVVRVAGMTGRAVGRPVFAPLDVRGKAVLVHTGWDARGPTDGNVEGQPYLTEEAALYLRGAGAALVGIDAPSLDDPASGGAPAHAVLLGAGIPVVEHLRGLEQLPVSGFRFSAVPVEVRGPGTFPVRAYARVGL